jgi:hypothetical protein
LQELVLHVRPPKGCAIVLTERPFRTPSDPNWVATVGPMGTEYSRRYTAKAAELQQTCPTGPSWAIFGRSASQQKELDHLICHAKVRGSGMRRELRWPVKYVQSHWRCTRRRFCSCGRERMWTNAHISHVRKPLVCSEPRSSTA